MSYSGSLRHWVPTRDVNSSLRSKTHPVSSVLYPVKESIINTIAKQMKIKVRKRKGTQRKRERKERRERKLFCYRLPCIIPTGHWTFWQCKTVFCVCSQKNSNQTYLCCGFRVSTSYRSVRVLRCGDHKTLLTTGFTIARWAAFTKWSEWVGSPYGQHLLCSADQIFPVDSLFWTVREPSWSHHGSKSEAAQLVGA